MFIPTYILAIKDTTGTLRIAESRRNDLDLPISFDEKYAEFLFEFCELRIRCKENDQILLLKGDFDISDIEQDAQFVEIFKQRVREISNFSGWSELKTKTAMSEQSTTYRQRVSRHLLDKQTTFQNQQENAIQVA
mgnify:CR=1 FL=1